MKIILGCSTKLFVVHHCVLFLLAKSGDLTDSEKRKISCNLNLALDDGFNSTQQSVPAYDDSRQNTINSL